MDQHADASRHAGRVVRCAGGLYDGSVLAGPLRRVSPCVLCAARGWLTENAVPVRSFSACWTTGAVFGMPSSYRVANLRS